MVFLCVCGCCQQSPRLYQSAGSGICSSHTDPKGPWRPRGEGYTCGVSLFKSASTVSLWTLVSRVTGLARELLIAATFGASAMTDAFNVAFRIPNLFRRLFAEGAFAQAFVPVLASTRSQEGDERAVELLGHVATALFWVLALTCVVGVAAAPVLVWGMASGLGRDAAAQEAAVFMTRWMFPYIGFMSLVALAAGVLNTWKRFAVPAATPVLLNVSMVACAWWGGPWFESQGWPAIYALAAGVMLGGLTQLGVQLWALRRLGLRPHLAWPGRGFLAAWRDPGVGRILGLMAPALLGVSVAQISLIINTQIASHLTPGSVTWLGYADRLMEFPTAMLGVALGVVLLPALTQARASGDQQRYSGLIDDGLRWVMVLALPCAVALLIFAKPLVSVLFHYGAFTDRDLMQTSLALVGYGVGLIGLVAIKVLAPGFYASQDTRTPMRIALGVLALTQLLNLLLVPWLGHAGLALAIGLGALVNASALCLGLVRQGRYQPRPGWARYLAQVVLACAVLALPLWWFSQVIDWAAWRVTPWARVAALAVALLTAAIAYGVALWALRVPLQILWRR